MVTLLAYDVADMLVLVDAGITTSVVDVGTQPQSQLPAVFQSLVPTLAKVQVMACADEPSAKTQKTANAPAANLDHTETRFDRTRCIDIKKCLLGQNHTTFVRIKKFQPVENCVLK